MAMEFVMAALILKGSGGDLVADAGVDSGSCWVFSMVASSVDSEIGSNLLAVVNWRMGTEAPLSEVIRLAALLVLVVFSRVFRSSRLRLLCGCYFLIVRIAVLWMLRFG